MSAITSTIKLHGRFTSLAAFKSRAKGWALETRNEIKVYKATQPE
jgi:hypothetical protein